MDIEAIKKILNSGTGVALKEYLQSKLYQLKNIDNVSDKDTPSHQAIEIKSQKKAYLKLKEILQDIMDLSEETKEKDPRDNYNVE
jgi:hypothetical protein